MRTQGVYFRATTAQQRRLLFARWEESGSVTQACAAAHVSRMLFYNWKARFEQEGYPGLEHSRSRARKHPARKAKEIEEQVVETYQAHPDWGKKRIAQELAKTNSWVPVVSANTVKRILTDANLWTSKRAGKKGP